MNKKKQHTLSCHKEIPVPDGKLNPFKVLAGFTVVKMVTQSDTLYWFLFFRPITLALGNEIFR